MKKSIIAISLASLVLAACSKTENKKVEEQTPATTETVSEATVADTAHTAENALDWNGTYKGILPCADCEGIKTELELNSDKTYDYGAYNTFGHLGANGDHLKELVWLSSFVCDRELSYSEVLEFIGKKYAI